MFCQKRSKMDQKYKKTVFFTIFSSFFDSYLNLLYSNNKENYNFASNLLLAAYFLDQKHPDMTNFTFVRKKDLYFVLFFTLFGSSSMALEPKNDFREKVHFFNYFRDLKNALLLLQKTPHFDSK